MLASWVNNIISRIPTTTDCWRWRRGSRVTGSRGIILGGTELPFDPQEAAHHGNHQCCTRRKDPRRGLAVDEMLSLAGRGLKGSAGEIDARVRFPEKPRAPAVGSANSWFLTVTELITTIAGGIDVDYSSQGFVSAVREMPIGPQ